jgi:hypothetical protein
MVPYGFAIGWDQGKKEKKGKKKKEEKKDMHPRRRS